jgi:glycosidase
MFEQFGVSKQSDGAWAFRLFVPDNTVDSSQYTMGGRSRITGVKAVGDFQSQLGVKAWSFENGLPLVEEPHQNGRLFVGKLPLGFKDGYYQYKYIVSFENGSVRWIGDPCTKYGGAKLNNSAFVIGGNKLDPLLLERRLPWQDLIIYELMTDDFTKGYRGGRAPIDAVLDKLDYIAGLGFNAIEFMPWIAWPDENPYSWGYDPAYYFAAESLYVGVEGDETNRLVRINRLVNECHKRGLHVILDVVLQHAQPGSTDAGFPYYWLWQQPEESPFYGQYTDAYTFGSIPLNYFNKCTQQFAIDVCCYWAEKFGLDGLRFDQTSGFRRDDDPNGGIAGIINGIRDRLGAAGSNFSYIIEDRWDYSAIDATNRLNATNCWYDVTRSSSADYLSDDHRIDTRVMRVLNANKDFQADKGPVTYLENHDHSTITLSAGGRSRWCRLQPYIIALYTMPGAVMVGNGQEFGRVEFLWEDDHDKPANEKRVQPRPLRWEEADDDPGQALREKYARLAGIRAKYPGLCSSNFYPDFYDEAWTQFGPGGYGVNVDKQVVIYHRWGTDENGRLQRFIVLLNFSRYDQVVDLPFSTNGGWDDLLNGFEVQVTDYCIRNFQVRSSWGHVFYQAG